MDQTVPSTTLSPLVAAACIMTVYTSSTSLTLTELTRGRNYSFAVAVTDSTGQHGPWSEQLMVEYNGKWCVVIADYVVC